MVHLYLYQLQQSLVDIVHSNNHRDRNGISVVLSNHSVDLPDMDIDFCLLKTRRKVEKTRLALKISKRWGKREQSLKINRPQYYENKLFAIHHIEIMADPIMQQIATLLVNVITGCMWSDVGNVFIFCVWHYCFFCPGKRVLYDDVFKWMKFMSTIMNSHINYIQKRTKNSYQTDQM